MSSFDRILQMVSTTNVPTFPLTAVNVVLEDLTVENASTHNTRITMRARGSGNGYSGEVDLFYTRVNMSALGVLAFSKNQQFTLDDVLNEINATKQAQLGLEDITNTSVPMLVPNTPANFILSARNASLAWLGNVEVTLTFVP